MAIIAELTALVAFGSGQGFDSAARAEQKHKM
jgi:hypothetical protein